MKSPLCPDIVTVSASIPWYSSVLNWFHMVPLLKRLIVLGCFMKGEAGVGPAPSRTQRHYTTHGHLKDRPLAAGHPAVKRDRGLRSLLQLAAKPLQVVAAV